MPDPLASLDDVAWPIRTERLLLRRALPQDADAVWRYRSLPVVAEFMTALISDSAEFAVYFSDADRLARTVVVEIADEPRAVVGDLMVRVQDSWSQTEVVDRARGTQAEIGWAFHPDHQGRGYATEAVRELLRVCFEDLGLHRVEALCFAANTPPGGSWSGWGCVARTTTSRTRCTDPAPGWTASATRCSTGSGAHTLSRIATTPTLVRGNRRPAGGSG